MVIMNLSEHVKEDRVERLTRIATTIGFGEIAQYRICRGKYDNLKMCITNTGVVIIKDCIEEKVITAYACGLKDLQYIYHGKPPASIRKVVLTNLKKRKFLFEI